MSKRIFKRIALLITATVFFIAISTSLQYPSRALAFDGERMLVTNFNGTSVSLWKASDLTPIGTFSTGGVSAPVGVCSDGLNFWITFSNNPGKLARF